MAEAVNFIHLSFELAAQRCEDMTPLIYRRLFRDYPETQTMFRTEGSDLVKGSMFALTVDAILDFAGDRAGPYRMIPCEVSSHDAYGTSPKLFRQFFKVIADTLQELLGSDWTSEIDDAWQRLLIDIDQFIDAELSPQAEMAPRIYNGIPISFDNRSMLK